MLRQITRRFLRGRNNVTCWARNIRPQFTLCGAFYSSSIRSIEKHETPEQDTAVAIFEKITRPEALINLLSKDIGTELRQNIILNPDRNSKLRHVEVTEDKIRLEYSQITPQFTKFASLMQANSAEQAQYPAFLVPCDAVNLTWCGGGATLVLDKRKTLHYLRTLRALSARDDSEV